VKRGKVSKKRSARKFNKASRKTKKPNVVRVMRGGYRL